MQSNAGKRGLVTRFCPCRTLLCSGQMDALDLLNILLFTMSWYSVGSFIFLLPTWSFAKGLVLILTSILSHYLKKVRETMAKEMHVVLFRIQQHETFCTRINLLVLFTHVFVVCISFIKITLEMIWKDFAWSLHLALAWGLFQANVLTDAFWGICRYPGLFRSISSLEDEKRSEARSYKTRRKRCNFVC